MINKNDILDVTINMLKSGIYSKNDIAEYLETKRKDNGTDKQPKKVLQTKPNTKQK